MHDGYVCLYVENVCFHGLYFSQRAPRNVLDLIALDFS